MAITYSAALKTARLTAILNAIDAGSGPGTLEVTTAGGVLLATETLAKPSATVSGSTLTFSGVPISSTVATSGTAALARIKDSSGTVVIDGLTVGTSNANIVLNTTALVQNQTLTLNSGTITHG